MSHQHLFEGALQWTGRAGEDEHGKLKLERAFVIRFKDVSKSFQGPKGRLTTPVPSMTESISAPRAGP